MKIIGNLFNRLRLVDKDRVGLISCFVVLFLLALYLRYKLIPAQTFDYVNYLKPWYEYLHIHGLQAFHNNFANYNTPYLLLIWFMTHLSIGPLGAIKLISIFFDVVLALSVGLVVSYFRPKGYWRYAAFIATLFLPTVFLNSSLWGQSDGIYASFTMLAFYFCLKNQAALAWILWGVAFGFKLQAIFFLPFLIFVSISRKWKWYVPLYAVLTFCILSALPVVEGRSLLSTLGVYVNQARYPTANQEMLSWFSPTIGQLFPAGGVLYSYFKEIMLVMAAGASVVVVSLAFYLKKIPNKLLILIFTTGLFIIPFLLPGIHERYMYLAEISALICAFVIPRLAWIAITMQVVSIITYNSYFTRANQAPQVPYAILSLIVLAMIYFLVKASWAEFDLNRIGKIKK